MLKKGFWWMLAASLVVILLFQGRNSIQAQNGNSSALTGQVSSQEEGPREVVIVGAKKAGSTIAISVVTDKQGRYSFPANRLEAGQYSLRIRAV